MYLVSTAWRNQRTLGDGHVGHVIKGEGTTREREKRSQIYTQVLVYKLATQVACGIYLGNGVF